MGIIAFSPAIVEPLRGFIDLFLSDSLIQTPPCLNRALWICRSSAKLVGEYLEGIHNLPSSVVCLPVLQLLQIPKAVLTALKRTLMRI